MHVFGGKFKKMAKCELYLKVMRHLYNKIGKICPFIRQKIK